MEFKVRDKRNKNWFYLDNEYLNGYAKIFGAIGTAIYVSLCRHADEDQKCFPSQELIAEELNIHRNTVRKHLDLFEEHNLIKVIRERNKDTKQWENNVYYLLDKSQWMTHAQPLSMDKPCTNDGESHAQPLCNKNTNLKNTNHSLGKMDIFLSSFSSLGEEYKAVLNQISAKTDLPEDTIHAEIKKFVSYWTETNKSGKKQRWEAERFFEVNKRLATWFGNVNKFNKQNKGQKNIIGIAI